jgi:hypothetical protein
MLLRDPKFNLTWNFSMWHRWAHQKCTNNQTTKTPTKTKQKPTKQNEYKK